MKKSYIFVLTFLLLIPSLFNFYIKFNSEDHSNYYFDYETINIIIEFCENNENLTILRENNISLINSSKDFKIFRKGEHRFYWRC